MSDADTFPVTREQARWVLEWEAISTERITKPEARIQEEDTEFVVCVDRPMSYSDKQLIDLLGQLDFAETPGEAHDYVAGFHRAIEMAIHIVETGKESNPSYSSRQTGVVNLEIPPKMLDVRNSLDHDVIARAYELAPGVDKSAWINEALRRDLIKQAHPSIGFDLTERGKRVEAQRLTELQDERNRNVLDALTHSPECATWSDECCSCGADP